MDVTSLITLILSLVGQIPVVGHLLVVVLPYLLAIPVLVTAFVGLWHAVVVFLKAVGQFPGLGGLSAVADSLQVEEKVIDDFTKNVLLPILNQLSSIPLPKK